MMHVNLTFVVLSLGGCVVYVSAMSALGRWLSRCSECTTVAYAAAPIAHGRLSA
jgi:hypothetical protein